MLAHSYAIFKLLASESAGPAVATPTLPVLKGCDVHASHCPPRGRHWDPRAEAQPSSGGTEVPNTFGPAAFYEHVDASGEYMECGVSESQFSEDKLRRAKRQGITSRAFRYLTFISAGIK